MVQSELFVLYGLDGSLRVWWLAFHFLSRTGLWKAGLELCRLATIVGLVVVVALRVRATSAFP
jgi:hypothetical protein